ncbi:MAG: DUF952 domain-containing protein [Gemmataceae bacterium]|nr:DUF952 domain-containing protein [Gemmataceae bacterium]MDW8263765.1 DUF952 domain-containing protein [Gemmataceae bacterium]
MRSIYHVVPRRSWDEASADPDHPALLDTEGFVHCSYREQLSEVVRRHFVGRDDLLVLEIDPTRLDVPLREEPSAWGDAFPHIYGPIPRAAIVNVKPWPMADW